ncbi:MAG: hypothetical protein ACFCUN_04915 [Hyphomicrobiaceae bacterium]
MGRLLSLFAAVSALAFSGFVGAADAEAGARHHRAHGKTVTRPAVVERTHVVHRPRLVRTQEVSHRKVTTFETKTVSRQVKVAERRLRMVERTYQRPVTRLVAETKNMSYTTRVPTFVNETRTVHRRVLKPVEQTYTRPVRTYERKTVTEKVMVHPRRSILSRGHGVRHDRHGRRHHVVAEKPKMMTVTRTVLVPKTVNQTYTRRSFVVESVPQKVTVRRLAFENRTVTRPVTTYKRVTEMQTYKRHVPEFVTTMSTRTVTERVRVPVTKTVPVVRHRIAIVREPVTVRTRHVVHRAAPAPRVHKVRARSHR